MDAIQSSWTWAGKLAFRFFVVYFILFALPFPLGYIPGLDGLADYYYQLLYAVVPWFAKHLLVLDITVSPNGSGDTTYHYIHIVFIAILSLAACIVWSILDRRRSDYDQAAYWVMIGVRYYLGLTIMGYGFSKIFMMQFQLHEARMTQTYGESSPMGLLWSFMGYSFAYNLFAGLGEVAGSVLLLFRRTTTAGSLLLIAIMSNVVILNFAYDVPVKIFSSHLLAMAIMVALCDGKRIVSFLLNKPAIPMIDRTYLTVGRIGKMRVIGNALLVCVLLVTQATTYLDYKKQFAIVPNSVLNGEYEAKEFSFNGIKAFEPNDTVVWNSVACYSTRYARITSLANRKTLYETTFDTTANTLSLKTQNDRYDLHYRRDGDNVELWGTRTTFKIPAHEDTIRITLEKSTKQHLLLTRGFNWVNEYPFNR